MSFMCSKTEYGPMLDVVSEDCVYSFLWKTPAACTAKVLWITADDLTKKYSQDNFKFTAGQRRQLYSAWLTNASCVQFKRNLQPHRGPPSFCWPQLVQNQSLRRIALNLQRSRQCQCLSVTKQNWICHWNEKWDPRVHGRTSQPASHGRGMHPWHTKQCHCHSCLWAPFSWRPKNATPSLPVRYVKLHFAPCIRLLTDCVFLRCEWLPIFYCVEPPQGVSTLHWSAMFSEGWWWHILRLKSPLGAIDKSLSCHTYWPVIWCLHKCMQICCFQQRCCMWSNFWGLSPTRR